MVTTLDAQTMRQAQSPLDILQSLSYLVRASQQTSKNMVGFCLAYVTFIPFWFAMYFVKKYVKRIAQVEIHVQLDNYILVRTFYDDLTTTLERVSILEDIDIKKLAYPFRVMFGNLKEIILLLAQIHQNVSDKLKAMDKEPEATPPAQYLQKITEAELWEKRNSKLPYRL